MKDIIKHIVLSYGADVCGVAGIERFTDTEEGFAPQDIFDECKSVITFGLALPKGLTKVNPRLIYGHYNELSISLVDSIAFQASRELEKRFGCSAVPMPCDSPYEYWDKEEMHGKGLISMKHAAVLSGLGWMGKNTLLINPKYGNLLTVGMILTDLEMESDEMCGDLCIKGCAKCIDSCPVSAIKEETVIQKLCRNYTYGKNERGFDTVECNTCRNVCPLKYGIK